MQRLSWERTTPEGWQDALKQMILLHSVSVTPAEARSIVKYLSNYHGLAPEEARPVMYDPERRIHEETDIPSEDMRATCAKCHSFARPLSWRRSPGNGSSLPIHTRHAIRFVRPGKQLRFSAEPLHCILRHGMPGVPDLVHRALRGAGWLLLPFQAAATTTAKCRWKRPATASTVPA